MSANNYPPVADNTPIIVGAGQYTEHLTDQAAPAMSGPMDLAARAAQAALGDSGGKLQAGHIDTVACIRLFSDSAPAWACPFGSSDNPPESIARRLGITPGKRIYSVANGAEPLKIMAELMTGISRGEISCALLTGTEAIANQRHALRNGIELDWSEQTDQPMDDRGYEQTVASPQEMVSGMYMPAHYYALIDNYRAWQQGRSPQQHLECMAALLSPLSEVASQNPYAFRQKSYSSAELMNQGSGNYPISLPYSKLLVAQDAVNQAAALVLTSAGQARELGISPERWIFLQGYAEGEDQFTSQRLDPGTSEAMRLVFSRVLDSASARSAEFELIDIYSCFPCAVEAARDALGISADSGQTLTVTGGLPFFGGPGNNYSMHALAEMVRRLRGSEQRALVTANGGILSKHAAAVLASDPFAGGSEPLSMSAPDSWKIATDGIPKAVMAAAPQSGKVLSYTVIFERNRPDRAAILGETASGERFLASSDEEATVEALKRESPADRAVTLTTEEGRHSFNLAD